MRPVKKLYFFQLRRNIPWVCEKGVRIDNGVLVYVTLRPFTIGFVLFENRDLG